MSRRRGAACTTTPTLVAYHERRPTLSAASPGRCTSTATAGASCSCAAPVTLRPAYLAPSALLAYALVAAARWPLRRRAAARSRRWRVYARGGRRRRGVDRPDAAPARRRARSPPLLVVVLHAVVRRRRRPRRAGPTAAGRGARSCCTGTTTAAPHGRRRPPAPDVVSRRPAVVVDGLWEAYRRAGPLRLAAPGRAHLGPARRRPDRRPRAGPRRRSAANGSGKTTLLQVLAGVLRPTPGRVDVRGRVASLVDLSAGFHRDLTGHENVLIGGVLLGLTRAEIRRRYDEIVAFSGLPADALDAPLSAYSAGMGLRLGFSLVVHTDPDVLLVDEVLAVGDDAFRASASPGSTSCGGRARAASSCPTTSTSCRAHCDEVAVLERGELVDVGRARPRPSRYYRVRRRDATAAGRRRRSTRPGPAATPSPARRRGRAGERPGRASTDGPSCCGTLVERQVRLRSKRSFFGVLWPLLAPLFLLGALPRRVRLGLRRARSTTTASTCSPGCCRGRSSCRPATTRCRASPSSPTSSGGRRCRTTTCRWPGSR